MDEKDVLRNARQYFIQQLTNEADKIRPLIKRIREYDQDIGDATDWESILGLGSADSTGPHSVGIGKAGVGGRPHLRPDEFTGMTYIEAAKSYLERVGH